MAVPSDPIQTAFQSVIQDFKNKLKDDMLYEDILKTTSIDEVYDAADRVQEEQAKNGHLRHLAKIAPYLERLSEYSSAIDTFVQAKPTSNMKKSFDAIVNTTAEIGDLLPEFTTVTNLFSQNTHLKDVLVLFFQDILDFYIVALKFFKQPKWRSLFEALWPQQKERIQLVITRIQRHTLLMRSEVRLEHVREEHEARLRALEHFVKSEKANRLQEYHIIEAGISPIFYDDRLNWINGRIYEGTGKWLTKDTALAKWLDFSEKSNKVLWLQGIPGAARNTGRVIFAFLSHARSGTTSALSILHSLIFQLSNENSDLQASLIQSSRENLRNDVATAASLLRMLLDCAGLVFIVIDGVDEIDEVERAILLRQIVDISSNCPEARIMVSCRVEADIVRVLGLASDIVRVDSHNAGSIQAFVTRRSRAWLAKRNLPPAEKSDLEGLLSPIAATAQGMFLYAKVILSSLEYLSDVESTREELRALPENLDDA
ncbi:MAG: hypothetical protein Q9160_004316 [Pyrenula sp. 1 TL-2023]